MRRLLLAVVSLVGLVAAGELEQWGDSNLTALVQESKDGYVDVVISWVPGACHTLVFPLVTVNLTSTATNRTITRKTHDKSVVIPKQEFWTKYEVAAAASFPCTSHPVYTTVTAGPGKPHKPKKVNVACRQLQCNMTIEEAEMIKPVSAYEGQLCDRDRKCQSVSLERRTDAENQMTTMNDLAPKTTYSLVLRAIIIAESGNYSSDDLSHQFTTPSLNLPAPYLVEFNTTQNGACSGNDSHVKAIISWKMPDSKYNVTNYVVVLTDKQDLSVETNGTRAIIEPVAFEKDFSGTIKARFRVGTRDVYGAAAHFSHRTPKCIAPVTNFQVAKKSPQNVLFGWEAPAGTPEYNFTYQVQICAQSNCSETVELGTNQYELIDLQPGQNYSINVVPKSVYFSGAASKFDFTTLKNDWAVPSNITFAVVNSSKQEITYNVSWTNDENSEALHTQYDVRVCYSAHACRVYSTVESSVSVPLQYFSAYDFELNAIYYLPWNQTVNKSAPLVTYSTTGTAPEPIPMINISTVTNSSAVVCWEAPANVPKYLPIMYTVIDSSGAINRTSYNESITVANLTSYQMYNLTVTAIVTYEKVTYVGLPRNGTFRTDVGLPGRVENLKVEQTKFTNKMKVRWDSPKKPNGPLNFYDVKVTRNGTIIQRNPNVTGSTEILFYVPVTRSAPLNVTVSAVNVNKDGNELSSEPERALYVMQGVDVNLTVSVLRRTGTSLVLLVAPVFDDGRSHEISFKAVNAYGRITYSKALDLEVPGLHPYTNETIQISACYRPDFCNEEIQITGLTNVGGPSAVQNLTFALINRTNVELKWEQPKVLNGLLDGYRIVITDVYDSESKKIIHDVSRNQTVFMFNSTEEYGSYEMSVYGFNDDLDTKDQKVFGTSYSTLVETSGFTVPKPRNLSILAYNGTSMEIGWESPHNADYNVSWYFVEYHAKNMSFFTNNTNLSLNDLAEYTLVDLSIRGCVNSTIEGCGSALKLTARTDPGTPGQPTALAESSSDPNSVTISWNKPVQMNGKINEYELWISSKTDNGTIVTVGGDVLSYTVQNLQPDVEYTAHVRAVNIDHLQQEFRSEEIKIDFHTYRASFLWLYLLIIALCLVAFGGAFGGLYAYRRRRSLGEDSDRLLN